MDRLTQMLAGLLRRGGRLLPPDKQQWTEAVEAEVGNMEPGWPRLQWLMGGLRLVVREGGMVRRVGYGLGVAVVVVGAAWALWLSWRTVPGTDPGRTTERFRMLVGAGAFVGLPWVSRRRRIFGPVRDSVTARLVRVVGCGAMCALGLAAVYTDSHAGSGGIGAARFSWLQELLGLTLLVAVLIAPLVAARWWPHVDSAWLWTFAACCAVAALSVLPLQTVAVAYIAGILAVTSRRSPLTGASLIAGTAVGIAAGFIWYGLITATPNGVVVLVLPAGAFITAIPAGLVAARSRTGIQDPRELRAARVRQGLIAGMVAGAIGGIVATLISVTLLLMMGLGPLCGLLGGVLGGVIAADYPRRVRRQTSGFGFGKAALPPFVN